MWEPAVKEVQNGVTYSYICSNCNNQKLGVELDPYLEKFYKYVIESNDNLIVWHGNISKVIKCIFGHILATNKYSPCIYDVEMRNYINKNILPKNISLYLFYYPYDAIFTIKDSIPSVLLNKNIRSVYLYEEHLMVTCLYFYPFAFIVSDKNKFIQGVDLINLIEINSDTIKLSKKSWYDIRIGKLCLHAGHV